MKQKKPKITKEEQELSELRTSLLRVSADFDNFRKRTQKEKEEFANYLNSDLLYRILPVLDNFQLALKHRPKELEGSAWAQGIFHIEKQLEQILTDEGIVKIEAVGQPFNPHLHEAVEEVESELPPHTVTEEVHAGYRLKDRVLRAAKVKVSKGLDKAETPKEIKK